MGATFSQLIELAPGHERWIIYEGEEKIFTGWAWELYDKMIHKRETTLYKRIKNREVEKFCFHTDINHKKWQELGLMSPLMPGDEADYSYSDLQESIYYEAHLSRKEEQDVNV